MPRYIKKPVEIEARQYVGANADDILGWVISSGGTAYHVPRGAFTPDAIIITTFEGDHRADLKDWIIKGTAGEFYPCKPDIFAATYEKPFTDFGLKTGN